MDDSLNPFARQAAQETIIAKRDRILRERTEALDQRSELLAKIRRFDRELADCRAAARLFDLDVEFPEEDERLVSVRREEHMLAEQAVRRRYLDRKAEDDARAAAAAIAAQPRLALAQPVTVAATGFASGHGSAVGISEKPARPPIRDIVLRQLRAASPQGMKAADLRDYIERTFGDNIHEKTVGMTLYRLSQRGQVRRDGHNWFFGAASAETENPGLVGPGSVDMS